MLELQAKIIQTGTATYFEELAPTTRVAVADLRKAARAARQFETRKKADQAVRAYLQTGTSDRNVTSVIAEVIARQAYPDSSQCPQIRGRKTQPTFWWETGGFRSRASFVEASFCSVRSTHCPKQTGVAHRMYSFSFASGRSCAKATGL